MLDKRVVKSAVREVLNVPNLKLTVRQAKPFREPVRKPYRVHLVIVSASSYVK